MIRNCTRLLCTIVLAALSGAAFSQGVASSTRMTMLQSDSIEDRRTASMDIYGAGLDDKQIYQRVAELLEGGLPDVGKDSPRLDELAWHAKVLGGSGDVTYLPLLERVGQSNVRSLSRHAKSAIEVLREQAKAGRPYMDYEKVLLITEMQAERCRLIKQDTCASIRSAKACMANQKESVVEAGGNAIMYLATSSGHGLPWPFAGGSIIANFYACPPQQ